MKLPSFQFYPGDWVQDTRPLSLAAKGAWIDLLCAMWRSQTRGKLTLSMLGYSRVIGATVDQTTSVIAELTDMHVCDSVTESNGEITLINRRMLREEKQRESTRIRVKRFRNDDEKRDSNAYVTVPSSSSSSVSSSSLKDKDIAIAAKNAAPPSSPPKPPPKEKKPKAGTIEFWQPLVDHISTTWAEKRGGKYPWRAQDFKALKDACNAFKPWQLMALWNVYLKEPDPFVKQTGYSLPEFLRRLTRLVDDAWWKRAAQQYEERLCGPVDKQVADVLANALSGKTLNATSDLQKKMQTAGTLRSPSSTS